MGQRDLRFARTAPADEPLQELLAVGSRRQPDDAAFGQRTIRRLCGGARQEANTGRHHSRRDSAELRLRDGGAASVTTPLPLGLAPYISPITLTTAPTGIDWSTVGEMTADPSPAENMNEIWSICARSTARTDGFCNQVLRATADVE